MKRFLKIASGILALALAACGGGNAYAQQVPASNQVAIGMNKSADLLSAKAVDLTPGAMTITDQSGNVIPASIANVQAVTYADAFKNYVKLSGNVYINLSQTSQVSCVSAQTVIYWHSGPQTLNDGCAFASYVNSLSRR